MKTVVFYLCSLIFGYSLPATVLAQAVIQDPPQLRGINVEEHLGEKIPLDLEFTNDAGERVSLGRYFHQGKPVIFVLAYYRCPMLCTLVLNGVAEGVKQLAWVPGNEFQMLTLSIDPLETTDLAAAKKNSYLKYISKAGADEGWRFFTGDEAGIQKLAKALGFQYFYDEERKEYAHPAVAFILGEDGKISRYLYGIQFKERDLRLALVEASEGKVGNTIDRLLLYCYHYDPNAKSYVVFATNVMKLGGLLTMLALGIFVTVLWKRERSRSTHE